MVIDRTSQLGSAERCILSLGAMSVRAWPGIESSSSGGGGDIGGVARPRARPRDWIFGHMDPHRWDCCQDTKTYAKSSMYPCQIRLCTDLGTDPGNNPICVDPYD